METLAAICRHDPALLVTTPFKVVDLTDPESQAKGIEWWLELTGRGGEGMVVKPLPVHRHRLQRSCAAGREVPRAGVPADHLRA